MKNLVLQFNKSISWIFESFRLSQTDPEKTIGQTFSKYISNDKCILINHGLLLAACYMYFLLPKEKTVENIKVNKELFVTTYTKNDLPRRLRNSIAHGKIEIDENGDILFEDNNKKGNDPFKAKISPLNLSKLIEDIGKEYAIGQQVAPPDRYSAALHSGR